VTGNASSPASTTTTTAAAAARRGAASCTDDDLEVDRDTQKVCGFVKDQLTDRFEVRAAECRRR
jgi:hypothetical protein